MLIRLPQRVQDLDREFFSAHDEQSNCGLCPGARAESVLIWSGWSPSSNPWQTSFVAILFPVKLCRRIFTDEYSRAELHKDASEPKQDYPAAS